VSKARIDANTLWNALHSCIQHKLFSRRSILPTGNLANLCLFVPCRYLAGRSTTRCLKGTTNVTTTQSFADLGVGEPLIKVLAAREILSPFPIQVSTLPDTLAGRDVLGRGKTGSGKTLAFAIPLVTRLAAMRRQSATDWFGACAHA
jgi:ATP-dependent helicase YprA (DUF1998 family)